jgi:hypothetical protein
VISADNLPSRVDGNDTILVINRIGGDLRAGASTLGTLSSLLYDDMENALGYSFSAGCQYRGKVTCAGASCPPGVDGFVPAGRSGWVRLYGVGDIGLFGAVINHNSNARIGANAYNQGHNFHHLTLTNAASITIPVVPPDC